MSTLRLTLFSATAALFTLALGSDASAWPPFYQNPQATYGAPAYSSPPSYSWPNPGGPPHSYQQQVYWGRFMPGRQWGRFLGSNLQQANGFEVDPLTGQLVYVQGERWTNPFTGQPHGNVNVTQQNPDGSFSTTKQIYSRPGTGGGNRMPGVAVGP